MDELTLLITTRDNETAFRPGARITGEVRVEAQAAWDVDLLDLVLYWRTEGRGNTDDAVVQTLAIATKGEQAPPRIVRQFTFQLPILPITYHGVTIKIYWTLGLYAKAHGKVEQFCELPITSHPNPANVAPDAAAEEDLEHEDGQES